MKNFLSKKEAKEQFENLTQKIKSVAVVKGGIGKSTLNIEGIKKG